jgi:hypothetical protein
VAKSSSNVRPKRGPKTVQKSTLEDEKSRKTNNLLAENWPKKGSKMDPKNGTKIPPKNGPKTSPTILQFTTIFINFFNFQLSAIFANFFKIEGVVKGEQGLAALALGNFADEYEIEGDRPVEVAA